MNTNKNRSEPKLAGINQDTLENKEQTENIGELVNTLKSVDTKFKKSEENAKKMVDSQGRSVWYNGFDRLLEMIKTASKKKK